MTTWADGRADECDRRQNKPPARLRQSPRSGWVVPCLRGRFVSFGPVAQQVAQRFGFFGCSRMYVDVQTKGFTCGYWSSTDTGGSGA